MLKVFIPILSEHGDIKNVVEKEKYRLISIRLSKNKKNKKKAQVIDLNKQQNLSRYVNIYSPSSSSSIITGVVEYTDCIFAEG